MSNLKIFDWIESQIIDNILATAKVEYFNSGEIIFTEWETSNWKSYIIKAWIVDIKIQWKDVASLWEWEMFWEIALLNEETRTATVIATTNLELIVITLSDLISMINNDDNIINKQIMRRIEENIKLLEYVDYSF